MGRTVRVEVTAEDIAKGRQADCERCPIALALLRATGAHRVYADTDWCAVGDWVGIFPPESLRITTPRVAEEFMDSFDGQDELRDPVRPFSFDLELP